MIDRLLVVVVAVVVAAALLWWAERRRPGGRVRVAPGITVFTGPECTLCPVVLDALDAARVPYRIVDASRHRSPVRAVPTVVVGDERGIVRLRRSGRAAVTDMSAVVEAVGGVRP